MGKYYKVISCFEDSDNICCDLGGRIGPGGLRGLQTRWGALSVSGGFDTHPLPPGQNRFPQTAANTLVTEFIKSRRQGLSPRSLDYYRTYLNLARSVIGTNITGQEITNFLRSLQCTNGGKRGYYCCLRAFYNWLYSPKSGFKLPRQDNPMLLVDPPKVEKKIMPCLSSGQIDYLIDQASCARDKAIISLFTGLILRW